MTRSTHKYRTVASITLVIAIVALSAKRTIAADLLPTFNTDSNRDPTAIIVKVRPGFLLPPGQSPASAKSARARRIESWTVSYGVTRADALWQGVSDPLTAGSKLEHPGELTYLLTIDPNSEAEIVAEQLATLPWTEYAEPDHLVALHQNPSDPFFGRQWSLENSGQEYWAIVGMIGEDNDTLAIRTGTPGADIGFRTLYDNPEPRSDILVGVIDTGIDPEHEDLRTNMAPNPGEIPGNGVDDDHNGFIDDVYGWDFSGDAEATSTDIVEDNDITDSVGHGTHVSGIIAAVADNGLGIAGVADAARVIGIKMFPNSFFSVSARAVYYAVARGARVVNMSWGGGFQSRALKDALEYAHARGVVLIASTGNSGSDIVFYPAGYPQTIAVGSSHANDGLSPFSTYNDLIDVIAPGQQILSLRAANTDLYEDAGEAGNYIIEEKYLIASGTSMSAPHASGVAAALLSLAPGLTNERVREILRETAHDIRDPQGDGSDLPGWDRFTGAGRIDLTAAIAVLPGVRAEITAPAPNEWVGGEITITGTASGPEFAGYEIFIAPGHTPAADDWTVIATGSEPVNGGVLALWDSGDRNGAFTIRLDAGPDAQYDLSINLVQGATAKLQRPGTGDSIRVLGAILGSAAALDFESYRLEAIGPMPGTNSHTLFVSTKPVWNDTLHVWRTDVLSLGDYDLVLTVDTESAESADTVRVTITDPFAPGWPVTLDAIAHFAIATVNLDGDGSEEIICPTNDGLWVYRADGTVYPGWPRGIGADLSSAPAAADLDLDGRYEIIVAGHSAMNVFAFIGEQYEGWPREFAGIVDIYGGSVPTVGNLDGHGTLEIAALDRDGRIRVWHADGSDYTPDSVAFGSIEIDNSRRTALPTIVICDLDRDGHPELIAAGDDIHVFDGRTGLPYRDNATTMIASHASVNGLVVGDFNDDGIREIAYAAGDGSPGSRFVSVNIVDAHGVSFPGWPRELSLTLDLNLLYAMAAGDVDGDRIPEVFLAPYSLGEGLLYAFHADGSPVGSDSSNGLLANLPGSVSSIGLVDIDTDGDPEIIARVGEILTGPDLVYAIEPDGTLVPGYPIVFGFGASTAPATPLIGDLNRDGQADMVTLQSTDRVLAVWDLGTPIALESRPWPQFRADEWNSSVVPTPRYDIVHLMRLIGGLFRGVEPLPPYEPSDINCDGRRDIVDVVGLIDFLYRGGAAPCTP